MKYKNIGGIVLSGCMLFAVLQLYPFSLQADSDTSKAQAFMHEQASQNIQTIQANIQRVQDQFNRKQIDAASFPARFANTMILGDSLAAGLLEYGIMPDSIVLAKRGLRTDNMDSEIATAINYAPKAVFMEFGINDLTYCRGDAKRYIRQYEAQVEKVQKALPNTKIYINSLTPITKKAIVKNPYFGHVDEFNNALKKMCKTMHLTYIDNTHTLDFSKDVYEYDGVHPKYLYYPLWLSRMLKVAGL